MNEVEIKKELEKYGTFREKVLRLNEIGKFNKILYGGKYIWYYDIDNGDRHELISGKGGCRFCLCGGAHFLIIVQLKIKNCNNVCYFICLDCKDKNLFDYLCAYCLREEHNCSLLTKQKVTFYLSSQKTFPKDIRKLITNLFFLFFSFKKKQKTKNKKQKTKKRKNKKNKKNKKTKLQSNNQNENSFHVKFAKNISKRHSESNHEFIFCIIILIIFLGKFISIILQILQYVGL